MLIQTRRDPSKHLNNQFVISLFGSFFFSFLVVQRLPVLSFLFLEINSSKRLPTLVFAQQLFKSKWVLSTGTSRRFLQTAAVSVCSGRRIKAVLGHTDQQRGTFLQGCVEL